MAFDPKERSSFPFSGILIIAAAIIGGFWVTQEPLKSTRPVSSQQPDRSLTKGEFVQSRLWQDPFLAVEAHCKSEQSQTSGTSHPHDHASPHSLKSLREDLSRFPNPIAHLTVLPVLVDGSPYADSVESRLRQRYAVVSALGVSGYIPESAEYIRLVSTEPPQNAQKPCGDHTLPLEWYQPGISGSEHHVLVLWVKEQLLGKNPLTALHQLTTTFQTTFQDYDLSFRILGPRSSGSLGGLLKEASQSWSLPFSDTTMYSSWATAPNASLVQGFEQMYPSNIFAGFKAKTNISLERTIGSDVQLTNTLVEELERRGVDATTGCHHIILLAEWDTLYGRALPKIFQETAKARAVTPTRQHNSSICHSIDSLDRLSASALPWIHRFSYLRGLDGELPQQHTQSNTKDGKPNSSSLKSVIMTTESNLHHLAQPVGQSQLDYIRRLASVITDLKERLKGSCTVSKRFKGTCEEIKAIGVLGSDVHDKLLLLQALHPDFTGTLFFTTDLDAQLLHPSQYKWAKNLIVASHFGLTLSDSLQGSIPPFRDSYQTSLFYAALRALDYLRNDPDNLEFLILSSQHDRRVYKNSTPRLYETSLNQAIDLSVESNFSPKHSLTLNPPRPPVATNLSITAILENLLLILGFFILLLLPISSTMGKQVDQIWQGCLRKPLRLVFPVGIFIGVALLIKVAGQWLLRDGLAGEPLRWMSGVSTWPTEIIRLFAGGLCIVFMIRAYLHIKESDRLLSQEFCLPPLFPRPRTSWWDLRRQVSISLWEPNFAGYSAGQKSVSASSLWDAYRRRGLWQHRFFRCIPYTFGFLVLGGSLNFLFGFPHQPFRGNVSLWVDTAVLCVSVPLFICLIFFVVDATRLCSIFIKRLTEKAAIWPAELLEKVSQEYQIDPKFLPEILNVRFVAKRTEIISQFIYYPFIVLFLMIIARHQIFDNWDTPIGLALIFLLILGYAILAAVILRRSAEHLKAQAIHSLREKLIRLKGEGNTNEVRQLESFITEMETTQEGAFRPITQHPVLGAVALPSGGYSLLLLIEYLASNT